MWAAGGLQGMRGLGHPCWGPELPIFALLPAPWAPGSHIQPTPRSKAAAGWQGRQVCSSLQIRSRHV